MIDLVFISFFIDFNLNLLYNFHSERDEGMKLVINYDLIDEIKNASEPYGVMKIVRTYKKDWIKFGVPLSILTSAPSMLDKSFPPVFGSMLTFNIAITFLYDYIVYKDVGDFHKQEAYNNLINLIYLLRDNDINTDYDAER